MKVAKYPNHPIQKNKEREREREREREGTLHMSIDSFLLLPFLEAVDDWLRFSGPDFLTHIR